MKTVKFTDSDSELISKIIEYQKAHGISSFTGAVRQLCKVAIELEKIRH